MFSVIQPAFPPPSTAFQSLTAWKLVWKTQSPGSTAPPSLFPRHNEPSRLDGYGIPSRDCHHISLTSFHWSSRTQSRLTRLKSHWCYWCRQAGSHQSTCRWTYRSFGSYRTEVWLQNAADKRTGWDGDEVSVSWAVAVKNGSPSISAAIFSTKIVGYPSQPVPWLVLVSCSG